MKPSSFLAVALGGLLTLSTSCSDATQPEPPVVEPPAPPPAAPPVVPASLPLENIYLANADGSAITRLTQGTSPVWSPDGRKMLFQRGSDMYVMNPDGSNEIRLARATSGVWSPDGRKIAYWYVAPQFFNPPGLGEDEMRISVVNADGTNPTQLTRRELLAVGPQWSPDGSKIAFVGLYPPDLWNDGGFYPEHIYVMNADGTGQTQLTSQVIYNYEPQWSPDGRKIAFVDLRDGRVGISVVTADGTNTLSIELTRDPVYENVTHRWSPDGSKIAFASERNSVLRIFVMDADGSNPTQLASHTGLASHAHLQWIHGGNAIAFQTFPNTLKSVPVTGGPAKTVLTDAYQAVWSPGGSRIAFVSRRVE